MRRVVIGMFILCSMAGCGARHILLVAPNAGGSSLVYDCTAGTGPDNCEISVNSVPGSTMEQGTVFVTLPRDCNATIRKVFISDPRSANPHVTVTCASPENAPGSTP